MRQKYLAPIVLMFIAAAFLATPALAQGNGPKPWVTKYVASLECAGTRYGQVIFNTNPEDDGKYELEVEVEECSALADSTVEVKLNGVSIGSMYIDLSGNGKATFYVDSIDNVDDVVTVEGAITLTSALPWRAWVKGPGKK